MPQTRPAILFRPVVTALEDRVLCAAEIVLDSAAFPFSTVAKVETWYDVNKDGVRQGSEEFGASAVMVGPDTALTSAHVVYNKDRGGFATSVTISPGRDGSDNPYGTVSVRSWVIPSQYKKKKGPETDVAVLNISPVAYFSGSQSLGDTTSWLGMKVYSDSSLKGKLANHIGYPANTVSGQSQFRSSGNITKVTGSKAGVGTLQYSTADFFVEGGSSGAPIYKYNASTEERYVTGLHSKRIKSGTVGVATRLTSAVFKFIDKAEDVGGTGGSTLNLNLGVPSVGPINIPNLSFGLFDTQPAARKLPAVPSMDQGGTNAAETAARDAVFAALGPDRDRAGIVDGLAG